MPLFCRLFDFPHPHCRPLSFGLLLRPSGRCAFMKVLILGSGGREHALAWAVKRSQRVTEVVCAPGNGGISQVARCVPVNLKDVSAMVRLAETEQPALTIVGPELDRKSV